jgi:carnitine O-acetyltransferase
MSEWWLNAAYLEYRLPVIVHSSPGLVFPLQTFKSVEDQLSYAAKLTYGALSYKDLIDKEKIKPDMMGKTPLDMSQYKKIFGTTRNPAPVRDALVYNPNSQHIVVAFKNFFYKVNVTSSGSILSPEQIYVQLKQIVEETPGLSGIPVGLLTSDNRDTWAAAHERLNKDPVNAKSLKVIEESLFLLSIDRPNRPLSLPRENQPSPDVEDLELSERQTIAALQMLHGNKTNSGNRWFDKTVGFIVGTEGEVGLVYEHSPAEGPPIANMMDFIVQYMATNPDPVLVKNESQSGEVPVLLAFNLKDKKISKCISDAKDNLDT